MAEKRQRGHFRFKERSTGVGADVWDDLWKVEARVDVHPELIEIVRRWGGKRILEVGFGTGGDLAELAKLGYKCAGVEISRVALEKARRRLAGQVKLVLTDGGTLPLKDGLFDVVFHQGVMEHYRDPTRFLAEQRRVLGNSGVLIVDVPHKWNLFTLYRLVLSMAGRWYAGWERSYSEAELKERLWKAGFEVEEIIYRGIWPHRWGKFLYPERVVRKSWATKWLARPPFLWISGIFRWLYENNRFVRVMSSYNIVAVGRRKSVKVVVDARFSEGGGGVGEYIQGLVSNLSTDGCSVTLLSTKKLGSGAKSVVLPQRLHWLFWEQVQLPLLLWKLKPDVYHAAGNWGVPFISPCPVVLTIHDVIPAVFPGYFDKSRWPWGSRVLYRLRIRLGLQRARVVMCDTDETRKQLEREFKVEKDKIRIVHLAVNPVFSDRGKKSDEKVLKGYGLDKGGYILNNGGIDQRKNLERLVEAFSLAATGGLKLVITGGGSLKPVLIRLASKLKIGDGVVFTGWVTDEEVAALMRNTKLAVYPSLAEGFGLPVLEAMAVGVPIVASDLPVIKEVGRKVPIYVKPEDTENIAEGMARGLRVNYKRGLLGQKRAREFTWERTLKGVKEAYEEAFSSGR